eukprot:11647743-Alexandrium_andersonii.AAC.1
MGGKRWPPRPATAREVNMILGARGPRNRSGNPVKIGLPERCSGNPVKIGLPEDRSGNQPSGCRSTAPATL